MSSNGSKVTRNFRVLCVMFAISFFKESTDAAIFDGCDETFYFNKTGYYTLISPNHPNSYHPGTSCRYKFIAPHDHEIVVNCTIAIDKGAMNCSTEFFYFSRDGDQYLRDSEQFCGKSTILRKSAFRSVVLAYVSGGSKGSFQCQLFIQPQPCDCGWSINTKISNGENASVNEYPSMVALQYKTNITYQAKNFCGGSIISHRYILTAAHCVDRVFNRDIEACVGCHNIRSTNDTKYAAVYNIDTIIINPYYTPEDENRTNIFDIALLKTATDIEFSKGVGPICLPSLENANKNFAYYYVDVIGWGGIYLTGPLSPTLQKVTLFTTNNRKCRKIYKHLDKTHICTYDNKRIQRNSCQYDSGGAVILRTNRQFLIGIIQSGYGCETADDFGVNTRVTSHLKWILQVTGDSTCTVNM